MFDMLLESGHRPSLLPSWGKGVAVALHVVIVGAFWRAPAPVAQAPAEGIDLVFPFPTLVKQHVAAGPDARVPLPVVIGDPPPFAPPEIPTIPQGALVASLDGATVPITAHEGPMLLSSDGVYSADLVQEAPELLSAPTPVYPPLLHQAGVQGRVMVAAVVDTLGRAESGSVRIVLSDNPGFDGAALATVRAARFRPARVYGRAVRVLVQVPVVFRLN